ncbi:hypothetical protein FACS189452_04520 [Bacteroidia bacterium]|nr:hypothetical protein FACS189452_04520 [Bacteroidia bacterium]
MQDRNLIVELYDLILTERKDDRFGRVVSQGADSVDDLIRIAVERRTDLNAVTLKASYEILKAIALERLVGGATVNFGLSHYNIGVNGVFVGDHAKWDSSIHSLHLRSIPTAEAREAVKNTAVDVRGMAASGIVINSVTDVASGEVNLRLTPGGAANLSGSKIKIVGDDPTVGIYLHNVGTQQALHIASNMMPVNEPSKITFIIPSDLTPGDYKLSIRTQYSSSSINLKEPKSYVFDYTLTV